MKTHVVYLALVVAVMAFGLLAGSRLPQGVEAQPDPGPKGVVPRSLAQPPLPVASPKLRATLNGYNAVVFTAEGKTLASVHMEQDDPYSSNCAAKIWDVATAKEFASFKSTSGVNARYSTILSIAFAADGKTLAAAYRWVGQKGGVGYAVKLWHVPHGKELANFDVMIRLSTSTSLAFTADGKILAMAGLVSPKDPQNDVTGVIKLVDVVTGKERACLKSDTSLRRLAFSADSMLLASVSENGAVTLWDVREGKERDALPASAGSFSCVAFTPDGKTVAAGGADVCGIVRMWDVGTGQELATLRAHPGNNPVTALAISADGETLASASGSYQEYVQGPHSLEPSGEAWGEVKLWDLPSRRAWATIKGLKCPPESLAFSPDGKILATVGLRGDLKLWDMPSPKRDVK